MYQVRGKNYGTDQFHYELFNIVTGRWERRTVDDIHSLENTGAVIHWNSILK